MEKERHTQRKNASETERVRQRETKRETETEIETETVRQRDSEEIGESLLGGFFFCSCASYVEFIAPLLLPKGQKERSCASRKGSSV